MPNTNSRVTIHMVASLDGFIARKDGRVDWLETSDEYVDGDTLDPGFVDAFLKTIDCYVMGSRTYDTALGFEARGFGWSYGDKPTFVLTNRDLPRTRETVKFYSGDLVQFVNGHLRPTFVPSGSWEAVPFPANASASGWPMKFAIRSCRS
jgi:dihydrofolate reductase